MGLVQMGLNGTDCDGVLSEGLRSEGVRGEGKRSELNSERLRECGSERIRGVFCRNIQSFIFYYIEVLL